MAHQLITGLVTGAIRDIVDFTLTLSDLINLRLDGVVGDIVVSTWTDEVDRFKGLRHRLSRNGIVLLETAPVPRNIQPPALWSAWQQTKALSYGLSACDPDGFVLKTRTDKARAVFRRFMPHLQAGCPPVRQLGNIPLQFDSRIMVTHVRTATPLHIHDMVVFGHHRDLSRLACFDGRIDANCYPGSMGPEGRWPVSPFYEIPVLQTFFKHIHGIHFALALFQWAQSQDADALPEFVLRVLAAYYGILYTHFFAVTVRPHDDEFRFLDLFDLNSRKAIYTLGSNRGTIAQFNSQAVLDHTITRSWSSDDRLGTQFNSVLRQVVENISDSNAEWLSPTDWDELSVFENRYSNNRAFLRSVSAKTPADWNNVISANTDEKLSLGSAIELLLDNAETPPEHRLMLRQSITQKIEHDANLAGAYHAVGKSYLNGLFGHTDVARGQWWLKEAAKLRNADAQLDFAKLVYSDPAAATFNAQDRAQALAWLQDVSQRRDDARRFLNNLKLNKT
jgi:hypothetical protein